MASLTSHEVHATPSLLPPRSGTTPTALKVIQRQSTNFTRFTLPNFSNDSLRAAQLYVKSPILAAWVLWALRPPPPPTFLLDQRPEPGKDFLNVKAAWILITNASDFNRAETRGGFLYGPAVAGGPYYPAGTIGEAVAGEDLLELEVEFNAQAALAQIALESAEGNATIGAVSVTTRCHLGVLQADNRIQYGNLSTIDDYLLLYDQWKDTWPQGLVPGVASNYSQDLFFSMERLSVNPYAVRRLEPSNATLPFTISDSDAQATSGTTLQGLLEDGRLFYIDHSAQAKLNRTSAYAAACDAYFYIDDVSGDFLPLAIRTGVGANLIYTPQDEANDWLLAKMMFNGNDVFFAQFNHLAATHEVVQIVWMAAIRTLSTEHPIYGLLDRLTFQVFGVQPIAEGILFATGAAVDQIFGYTGAAAQNFTTDLYFGSQGRFQANYFLTDLQNRGLINSTFGPELSNFPFFEDASVIYHAIEAFMTSFVDSYYPSNLDVKTDFEVQSWAMDANVNAEVLDFPVTIATKEELVAILTHIVSFTRLRSTSKWTLEGTSYGY